MQSDSTQDPGTLTPRPLLETFFAGTSNQSVGERVPYPLEHILSLDISTLASACGSDLLSIGLQASATIIGPLGVLASHRIIALEILNRELDLEKRA